MAFVVATAGVDFFRVDRSGATRRLLVVAGVLVAIGATSIGAHLVRRIEPDVGHVVSLVGGLLVIAGLILGFGAMAMLVFENVYLLVREDDVLCHENGKETAIAWADLETVSADGTTGFVVFARRGGEPVRWFAGKNAKDVAGRLEAARRKAIHGLLRSDAPRA
ncbi:MAG: hypothetical protein KF764_03790 [Labilithrix sp.]|nr:hypothetical protein [Labilithrix sp.]MBX3222217.1 hypothetical protein [Labilithrix sp.]